jgi:large subunit ribosomal protein L30
MMSFAVIRVRGTVNIDHEIKETLRYLNLNRVNHCVVVPENPVTKGMLQKTKDYVTWGEIDEKTLEKLILSRGRIEGDHPLTDSYIKKNSDYSNIKELAKAIASGTTEYKKVVGVTPIFRLSPPKRGHGTVKRHFTIGGSLGYRGAEIGALLDRMI